MKGKSASSNFTKAIDEAIKKEKNIETERMSYMTYEMKLQEMQDFGYNKGKTDGNFVPPTAPHKGAAHGTSKK